MSKEARISAVFLASLSLLSCTSQTPVQYADIGSAHQWGPNTKDTSARVPYSYKQSSSWGRYDRVIIEPVILYTSADNQLGDLNIGEIMLLKKNMGSEFKNALIHYFKVSHSPGGVPGAMRIRITLTGAERNTAFLTTFSRFDIGMGSYNLVQAARDKRGTFSGSVYYTVEVYDEASDRLLQSFVTQQYPKVYDISATRGALSAAQAGIRRGAVALADELSQHR